MGNYCTHRNPHNGEFCQRLYRHGGKHQTFDSGHVLIEWDDQPVAMWMPPKPEPIHDFTSTELAQLHILTHGNPDVPLPLMEKIIKLLKESL